MRRESPFRLGWAIVLAGATAIAVALVDGRWEGLIVTLVGTIGAVLVARIDEDGAPAVAIAPTIEPGIGEVLDAVAEPVLLVRGGRIILANAAARTLLGDHVVGEDARVALRHPAAAEALAAPEGRQVELVGIGARDRRWEMRVSPTASGGRVVELIDHSEGAATERMRVDFVANASHELRTPLASILGFAETLEEAGDDPELRSRFLQIMMAEARRMQRLVEDLLSLSRIEADKYRLPDRPIDIAQLMDEICAELRRTGTARVGDVTCQALSGLPPVLGDRAQLSQMLHNLIGNAMKYGRAGTPVDVRLEPGTSGGVRLTVTDQGEGIAPEHLPRLTERFYRVDTGRSRSLGGTGLGLAIVKHVVERHRGQLDITSRVGIGTTFAVTLPATAAPAPGPAPGAVSSKSNENVTQG